MLSRKDIEKYIAKLENVEASHPFGDEVLVYKVDDKMFALIAEDKQPVRLSLRCDPKLSSVLRERYEEVMPGYHLNKKLWNTIVLSGQLDLEEVKGLILHSYELALKSD